MVSSGSPIFFKAQILFIFRNSPKKEIFLNDYKDIIQTPFIMGVVGSFEMVLSLETRSIMDAVLGYLMILQHYARAKQNVETVFICVFEIPFVQF